jgi:23S rRNA G2445 N2-methylase RlmL
MGIQRMMWMEWGQLGRDSGQANTPIKNGRGQTPYDGDEAAIMRFNAWLRTLRRVIYIRYGL